MKRIFVWLAIFSMPFFANAAPPSTKSLEALFALTNIEQNVETMKSQMFGLLKSKMDKALEGRKLTPDRQK